MTPTVSEASREEETLRYAASLLAQSIITDSPEPSTPSIVPASSSDSALAAYAQLGALRLNVDRVLISLFDGKRQHIVAEATSSTYIEGRPHHDNPDDPPVLDDRKSLFFLGTAIPRSHGACELTLDLPPDVEDGEPMLPISIIPDLTLDKRTADRPYFRTGTPYRFYAGTPIRSPQGIDIGVVCFVDGELRDTVPPRHKQFLRHLSILSMNHLQSRASAESFRRNERMVRGLGSMVEGTGSLSKWRGAQSVTSFVDVCGQEGALNAKQQHIQKYGRPEVSYKGPPWNVESDDSGHEFEKPSPKPSLQSTPVSDDFDQQRSTQPQSYTTYPENQGDEDMIVLKQLFSRAANIIRESIEVEGALFLDASIGSYGGLVRRAPKDIDQDQHISSSSSGNESTEAADEDTSDHKTFCGVMGFSNSDSSSINGDSPASQHMNIPEAFLARILRRYPEGQIFNFSADGSIRWGTSDTDSTSSGEEAKSADEILASSVTPTALTSPTSVRSGTSRFDATFYRHPRPKRGDASILQKMFPQARSVAIFPLWDSHKEKWHAGGLVWTMTASRIFTVTGELSYLRAFGSAVMAEVARIDVLRADKAKEDVLGSLSHEIRSPLHGIILGLELMHDTTLDPFQEDVLHTVETCGRTLLDTMDHLLDFSKVNHFLRGPKRRLANSQSRGMGQESGTRNTVEAGMMSLFSDIRLDVLLEEVVMSIYAGFTFQQSSTEWATRDRGHVSSTDQAGTLRRLESVRQVDSTNTPKASESITGVFVYLSIDPSVSWDFHGQPGALRRVIMNIFGNALKYTHKGSILVSMTQEPSNIKKKSRRRNVVFSVSDSGRGISSAFLQNRLFTPFTQENQLSSGSGLGLSIVKQIIHALGGRIGVESKPGHGTTVRVSIPLRVSSPWASPDPNPSANRDLEFKESMQKLKEVKVSLLGFADDFGPYKPLAAESSDARLCPKLFMETLCCHFLNLNLVSEPAEVSTDDSTTILVGTQQALDDILRSNNECHLSRPAVIICNSILAAHELSAKTTTPFPVFISQPIGPRKLAKTLVIALQRWEEIKAGETPGKRKSAGVVEPQPSASDSSHLGSYFPTRPSLSRNPSVIHITPDIPVPPTPLSLPDRPLDTSNESPSSTNRPQPLVLQRPTSPPREVQPPQATQESIEDAKAFLLVDDNAINLKILASYMKKLGRSHDNAANGLEALEACRSRKTHFKCIFMDISMPVMDGLEATRHIRAYEKQNGWDPALVIALTGLGSSKTQQEAFASGVDLFLTKPVPLKELGGILESKGV